MKSKVENKAAQVEVKDETFTVYISGIDVYGAIETNSRSDVNILAVVNPNTHQVLLVTTPRDYYVPLTISGGVRDKLPMQASTAWMCPEERWKISTIRRSPITCA